MPKVKFSCVLDGWQKMPNCAGVTVPQAVVEKLGGRGRTPIKGTINGFPFRTTIVRMGGRNCFVVNKEMRAGGKVKAGDRASLVLENDDEPRTVAVPPDLAKSLAKAKGARRAFDAMSYTHQKEWVRAVEEAKRPETRVRRIENAVKAMRERISERG